MLYLHEFQVVHKVGMHVSHTLPTRLCCGRKIDG